MTAQLFTVLFLFALVASTSFQLWLKSRQIQHVQMNRNQVPEAFATSMPLADHQKAADYTVAKARFARLGLVVEAAVLLLLTVLGGAAWLDGLARKIAGEGVVAGLVFITLVMFANGALTLPMSIWQTFVLEARFGFNKMTPALFVLDLIKSTLLSALLGLPLVALVLYFLSATGAYWWVWAWGSWVIFGLTLMAIFPTVIAPIFNKFIPLENEILKARIDALLGKCGFTSNGVFVMDGSKRSSHGNAYFTGFGKTKRIVFFDTLVERLQGEEIEAVLAHELGHFKHRHIIKRMFTMYGTALAALALAGYLKTVPWFYAGLGVPNASNAAFLVLFLIVLPVFTFAFGWIGSRTSRKHEYEADQYAVQQSSAAALESGLVKLYQDNASTLTPDPLHSLFYDSHPPAALRIAALKRNA